MHKSVQKQPTVLIVDDEDDILDLLAYNFEQANMATLRAHNGVEALQQARDNDIDLIILDVMMPQMDGLETCRRVRRHPASSADPHSNSHSPLVGKRSHCGA